VIFFHLTPQTVFRRVKEVTRRFQTITTQWLGGSGKVNGIIHLQ
jgi:hypothetical protein